MKLGYKEKIFITESEKETFKLGIKLAKTIHKGEVITLNGGLGTGKTVFVRGLAKGFGITEYITSPTFIIMNQYEGDITLNHFDVYRVNDPDELFEIGFEEFTSDKYISVIEWADLIQSILPVEYIDVRIEKLIEKNEDFRKVTIIRRVIE